MRNTRCMVVSVWEGLQTAECTRLYRRVSAVSSTSAWYRHTVCVCACVCDGGKQWEPAILCYLCVYRSSGYRRQADRRQMVGGGHSALHVAHGGTVWGHVCVCGSGAGHVYVYKRCAHTLKHFHRYVRTCNTALLNTSGWLHTWANTSMCGIGGGSV